ncbi:FAD/NAD(P)-binding oxidoreductase, partial [Staphylococcus aureus]|nr:FAD/NAD(P)-binding oxidoreductase [Staphylococcus aureus]
TVNYNYNLVEIDGDKKVATFEHIKTYDRKTISYDMLHVTPPMGPLDVVKESTLSDSEGWVDVNPTTLQHKSYSNVFALGDASNV